MYSFPYPPVYSFLQNGNDWVHFENNSIHLKIKDEPKIRISITLLQSNALIVGDIKTHNRNRIHDPAYIIKKVNLNTNILHNMFHRYNGNMATIKAHEV